ncbi:MAG: hypothetical protein QM572_15020 [Nocardioides sp.]|uniref:hypothetical protein n=1 Tax=Nocardioides sp. TaxID=35761 RepID=UPI0039E6B51C
MSTRYATPATLTGGLVVGLLIGLRVKAGAADDIVWGSVGEWVGGAGTALAVWVAVAELVGSRRAEERAREDLQRSNAMAVTLTGLKVNDAASRSVALAVIENGGSLPIFDAQVDLGLSLRGAVKANQRLGTIGTGGAREVAVSLARKARIDDLEWDLRFRDSYGTLWRSRNGVLELFTPGDGEMDGAERTN